MNLDDELIGRATCPVCMDTNDDKHAKWVAMNKCGHLFHRHCIEHTKSVAVGNFTCPSCKEKPVRNKEWLEIYNLDNVPKPQAGVDTPLKAGQVQQLQQQVPGGQQLAEAYEQKVRKWKDLADQRTADVASLKEQVKELHLKQKHAQEQLEAQSQEQARLRAKRLNDKVKLGDLQESLQNKEAEVVNLQRDLRTQRQELDRTVEALKSQIQRLQLSELQLKRDLSITQSELQTQRRAQLASRAAQSKISDLDFLSQLGSEDFTKLPEFGAVSEVLHARTERIAALEKELAQERALRLEESKRAEAKASSVAWGTDNKIRELEKQLHLQRIQNIQLEDKVSDLQQQLDQLQDREYPAEMDEGDEEQLLQEEDGHEQSNSGVRAVPGGHITGSGQAATGRASVLSSQLTPVQSLTPTLQPPVTATASPEHPTPHFAIPGPTGSATAPQQQQQPLSAAHGDCVTLDDDDDNNDTDGAAAARDAVPQLPGRMTSLFRQPGGSAPAHGPQTAVHPSVRPASARPVTSGMSLTRKRLGQSVPVATHGSPVKRLAPTTLRMVAQQGAGPVQPPCSFLGRASSSAQGASPALANLPINTLHTLSSKANSSGGNGNKRGASKPFSNHKQASISAFCRKS